MTVETSIVVRTLNEAKHLEALMHGIHLQNYEDWEIILVDSGSTDGSVDIARKYGARIFYIPSKEFTYGRSLNLGCQQALGKYLVFASGHVRPVTNNWLGNLIRPFQETSVAMVYGRQRGTDENRLSEIRDLHALFGPTSHILVDEPKGNNGNSAVRRELWVNQWFDETLTGLEDIDWAGKAERIGYRVYYAADAAVYHVHEETLRQVYRRYLREAIASKRMFPHFHFNLSDAIKGLPYFVLRDFSYAWRHGKKRKIFQVPGTRIAQFLGLYRGARYQKQFLRAATDELEVPETYQQVVVPGPGQHRLKQTAVPILRNGEVLIQVAYVGVSPDDPELAAVSRDGQNLEAGSFPLVPGRHYAGIVVKSGANATHMRKGQKVAGDFPIGCGHCGPCTAGNLYLYLCENRRGPVLDSAGGSHAQFLVKPSSWVHKLPMNLPLRHGPLVEPLAMCLEGLQKLDIQATKSACVVGAGPLGNLCAQTLLSWGLRVTVVDSNPRQLSLIKGYDVDTLVDLGKSERYDYLIDANGHCQALPEFFELLTPSAKALFLVQPYPGSIQTATEQGSNHPQLFYNAVAVHRRNWDEAIRMILQGQVRLDEHSAAVRPLEDYDQAWDAVASRDQFYVLLNSNKELEAL